MTADGLPDGLSGLSPEQVMSFLRTASDDEVRLRVRGLGVATVLGLLFDGWAQRVPPRPGRAPGVLVFGLDDDGRDHRHALALSPDGARRVGPDDERPRATLSTSVVRFLRVAAGAQDPKRLVLTGRMRVSGDILWAVTTLSGMRPA